MQVTFSVLVYRKIGQKAGEDLVGLRQIAVLGDVVRNSNAVMH